MGIKRVNKELTKEDIIEAKRKVAIQKRERLDRTGERPMYDNELDNHLTTDQFVKRHFGLIRYLADTASNYLPEHMRVSCQDDMRSRAMMAAGLYDKTWNPDHENGRTRRNWMIFVVRRALMNESRDLMTALGGTYAYAGKALRNLVDKTFLNSVESKYDEDESIRAFLESLDELDSYVFLGIMSGVTQLEMCKFLHKNCNKISDKRREIKERFKEATFIDEEESVLK